jgi:hypothetical protein
MSGSGRETGAASRVHVWPDMVSLIGRSAVTGTYSPNQVGYSNVCAAGGQENGGSNPPVPTK